MVLGKVIRFGIPLSFVYCTIYQQDVWREGDEKLILEQKRVWRDFFAMVDCGYNQLTTKLNLSKDVKKLNLASGFDSMDLRRCWNANVLSVFSKLDNVTSKSATFDFSSLTKTLGLNK